MFFGGYKLRDIGMANYCEGGQTKARPMLVPVTGQTYKAIFSIGHFQQCPHFTFEEIEAQRQISIPAEK